MICIRGKDQSVNGSFAKPDRVTHLALSDNRMRLIAAFPFIRTRIRNRPGRDSFDAEIVKQGAQFKSNCCFPCSKVDWADSPGPLVPYLRVRLVKEARTNRIGSGLPRIKERRTEFEASRLKERQRRRARHAERNQRQERQWERSAAGERLVSRTVRLLGRPGKFRQPGERALVQ